MRMGIAVSILAAGVGAVVLILRHRQSPLIKAHHIGIDLVNVRGMGEVHHVRRIASGGTHIYLKAHEISHVAQSFVGFRQAEELQMDETPAHVEGLDRPASQSFQRFRHFRAGIVVQVQIVVDNIHYRREHVHVLKQRLAVGIKDPVI